MRKTWKNKSEHIAFMSPDRKYNRDRLFLELSDLLLNRNRSVLVEDRKAILHLVMHKLDEEVKKHD